MPAASAKKSVAPRKRRVVSTPGVCGGQPRIAGTRIPVETLLKCKAVGFSDDRILEGYPALTRADLTAAWAYASRRPRRS